MNEHIGYLHNSDGIHRVGPDGFADIIQLNAAELDSDEPRALDIPVIDVAPESVTDTE